MVILIMEGTPFILNMRVLQGPLWGRKWACGLWFEAAISASPPSPAVYSGTHIMKPIFLLLTLATLTTTATAEEPRADS
jgi:hypothetical protein